MGNGPEAWLQAACESLGLWLIPSNHSYAQILKTKPWFTATWRGALRLLRGDDLSGVDSFAANHSCVQISTAMVCTFPASQDSCPLESWVADIAWTAPCWFGGDNKLWFATRAKIIICQCAKGRRRRESMSPRTPQPISFCPPCCWWTLQSLQKLTF